MNKPNMATVLTHPAFSRPKVEEPTQHRKKADVSGAAPAQRQKRRAEKFKSTDYSSRRAAALEKVRNSPNGPMLGLLEELWEDAAALMNKSWKAQEMLAYLVDPGLEELGKGSRQ